MCFCLFKRFRFSLQDVYLHQLARKMSSYLNSLTRPFFMAESVFIADLEQGVSRTEGRLR